MIKKMLVALFIVTLLPIAVFGQGIPTTTHREWEISAFFGGSYFSDKSFSTPVAGASAQTSRSVGLKYGSGAYMGVRVAENRWKNWGAIMEYSFSNQPLRITNLTDAQPMLALGHAVHRFSYDVAYFPLDRSHRLRPYGFAGPGATLYHVQSSSKGYAVSRGFHLSDPWKMSMNWGGGVKYLLKDKIAASFQFSDSITGVPRYGLPGNAQLAAGVFTAGFQTLGYQHNRLLSLSINYQWGSR